MQIIYAEVSIKDSGSAFSPPEVMHKEYGLSKRSPRGNRGVLVRRGAGRQDRIGRSSVHSGVYCSAFGVIPKKGQAGRWRLIVDLYSPEGHSVNDGVDKDMSSLSYLSVDEVMSSILGKGRGTLLAKTEIQQAYRNIHLCPEWNGKVGSTWTQSSHLA